MIGARQSSLSLSIFLHFALITSNLSLPFSLPPLPLSLSLLYPFFLSIFVFLSLSLLLSFSSSSFIISVSHFHLSHPFSYLSIESALLENLNFSAYSVFMICILNLFLLLHISLTLINFFVFSVSISLICLSTSCFRISFYFINVFFFFGFLISFIILSTNLPDLIFLFSKDS